MKCENKWKKKTAPQSEKKDIKISTALGKNLCHIFSGTTNEEVEKDCNKSEKVSMTQNVITCIRIKEEDFNIDNILFKGQRKRCRN